MKELLHPNQFCAVPGRTIFEVMATVREAIAQVEVSRVPLYILSLDFQEALDRIPTSILSPSCEAMDLVTGFWNEWKACMRKPHPPSKLTATYLDQSRWTAQLDRDTPWACCSLPYVWTRCPASWTRHYRVFGLESKPERQWWWHKLTISPSL